ncbi:glycoside hydrolase family 16 protein [Streptomyces sp. ID05-04B]|uniref:glycoside hydrolase family 16 protein n=1 Tax=unclassified Streptomyces TaxID=2593676 RepID=UPI001C1F7D35|nr:MULTISPECIES: glycoside hydrolase family 16 protein [unclassified Streptomyces]MDX5566164.1 glycoside hydrolase family 16 protein [Streptomyces sp. ID05-04B]
MRAAAGLIASAMLCTNLAVLPGTASAAAARSVVGPALFDDFNYLAYSDQQLTQRGWTLRSGQGGPGVPGATWKPQNITFATTAGNSVMTMRSGTSGTAATTQHTEIYQQRKFHHGTYAARVRFSDAPAYGPDGDHMVQTFFTISPLNYPMDPDYSELDFEYLPNGGWGIPGSALLGTSWETYAENPPQEENVSTQERASFNDWHDLVITVDGTNVTYYVDGRLFATHGEPYLPESTMSIRFNHWLIDLTGVGGRQTRAFEEKVDYVYFAQDQVLSPADVQAAVADYRSRGVTFEDTV